MQKGLAGAEHTRVEMRDKPMLVDARHLLCNKWRMAEIIIHARDSKKRDRYMAAVLAKDGFSLNLRFRICPSRLNRRFLIDGHVGSVGGFVKEHRAREDESLDLKWLQSIDEPSRAFDCNLVIEWVRLPGDIVVGSQVHDGGNPRAEAGEHLVKDRGHTFVGRQVDIDGLRRRRRVGWAGPVQTDQNILTGQSLNYRASYEATRPRDQYDRFPLLVRDEATEAVLAVIISPYCPETADLDADASRRSARTFGLARDLLPSTSGIARFLSFARRLCLVPSSSAPDLCHI